MKSVNLALVRNLRVSERRRVEQTKLLRWLQPRGRRQGLAIMHCFVSSRAASGAVTAAVCVVVVVVKVAGPTQSWFSA